MYKKWKAGACDRSGSKKHNHFADDVWFSRPHLIRFGSDNQCKKCSSDYMRHAVDGYCLGCQQRVEFIMREHPEIFERSAIDRGGAL